MSDYEYWITTEKLVPPIGGMFHYAAKLSYFYRFGEEKNERINPGLGERYGRTEEEARQKLEVAVKDWIAKRDDS